MVHCAAWTAVDAAEDEDKQEIVRKVNVLGTENIAKVCKKLGIKMMYLSTDYIDLAGHHSMGARDCASMLHCCQTKLARACSL